MMRYQFGYVDADLRPVATVGGKRFRPMLCLLACEAVDGDWRLALPAASAIELLHNFSLIHDDIEDHDPSRRHRPTVWKVWGEPHAINIGDAVFAASISSILDLDISPEVGLEIGRRFAAMAKALTHGQYLDMDFEARLDVQPNDYLDMIAGKTASLIAFSVETGARIGGGTPMTRDALTRFGLLAGQAFQIQDDIQGIWGTSEETGKDVAKDLLNRKKSLPVLLAMQNAGADEGDTLRSFYSGASDDIDAVIQVLTSTDARRRSTDHLQALRSSAEESLAQAHLSREYERRFLDVIEEVTQ
jgi:geranylgeranyl diphosphate synthase type I